MHTTISLRSSLIAVAGKAHHHAFNVAIPRSHSAQLSTAFSRQYTYNAGWRCSPTSTLSLTIGNGNCSVINTVQYNTTKQQYTPHDHRHPYITQSSSSSSSRPKRKGNDNSKNNTSRKSRTKPSSKGDGSCKHGRNGNPLMNEAVKAKVNNPNLSLVAALMAGGFVFPDFNAQGISMSEVRDTDNVTLYQRRNQLLRRLRYMKGKGSKPK
mmetsp:Transcript_3037/g.6735  ORF Transcript_3037/g.6735 Transcript_3037/m.6735 type:complete len:210 (+) Transcript_3037:84-713(+)